MLTHFEGVEVVPGILVVGAEERRVKELVRVLSIMIAGSHHKRNPGSNQRYPLESVDVYLALVVRQLVTQIPQEDNEG